MLSKVTTLFGFLSTGHRQPSVPRPDTHVFHRVWQVAFASGTEAPPEETAAALSLPWTEREAAEWKRHCQPCVSCGAWMYDPLTDHCHRCWDW